MKISEVKRQLQRYEQLAKDYSKRGEEIPSEIYSKLNHYSHLHEELDELSGLNGLGSPYIPSSRAPRLNVDVPDRMNDETHAILDKINEKVGGIDEYVRKKLGFKTVKEMYSDIDTNKGLSAEQIDAVAMAIYNIESKNQMMIVSDQTGVGKGRIAAAVMRYAHQIGKKPIFITIRANLFTDIYRDMQDLYMDDLTPIKMAERDEFGNVVEKVTRKVDPETGEVTEIKSPSYKTVKNPKFTRQFIPFILNNKGQEDPSIKTVNGDIAYEVKGGSERKAEMENVIVNGYDSKYDCFLMTYSQFRSNDKVKIEWLKKIAKDNIIILDESHEAGGYDSNTGIVIRNVLQNSGIAGGLFLSATFAKDPKNMPLYAATTSIKYAGLKPEEFVFAMSEGGNALQEIISAKLAESGCFIRRERPLSNVVFNYITLDMSGAENYGVENKEVEHCAIFDNITEALKLIIKFQKEHVDPVIRQLNEVENEKDKQSKGRESLSYKSDPIFNRLFQIVNQAVFSLKAESVAARAIQRLKQGMKPVLTFENTMDSWMERLQESSGNQEVYSDFAVVIKKGIEQSLEYTKIVTTKTEWEETDESGKKTSGEKQTSENVRMKIDVDNDLDQEGQEMYYQILDKINASTYGISISPIDVIKTRIKNAGFTVGEITGRKYEIEFTDNSMNKGRVKNRKKEDTNRTVYQFQTNKIDCMLLNQAGSTGISLHAQKRFPEVTEIYPTPPKSLSPANEVKKRVMIVCQPNLDINKMVQTWGRVNRSGQAYRPEYDFITLAVPAETRLMMFLQRKLRSLDANTTSNQKQNESVINLEDFMNRYGDQVVVEWLDENKDLDEEMYEPLWKKASFRADMSGKATRTDEFGEITHYFDPDDAAKTVSGRVALLNTNDQRRFYNEVNERYISAINKAKIDGTYDLEVVHMPLDAITLNRIEKFIGTDEDNPFAQSVYIEECEVNVLSKPYKKIELENVIESSLGDKTPEEYSRELVTEVETYFERKIADYRRDISEKYEKKINALKDTHKMKKLLEEEKLDEYRAEMQQATSDLEEKRNTEIFEKKSEFTRLKHMLSEIFDFYKPGKTCVIQTGEWAVTNEGQMRETVIKSVFAGFEIDRTKTNIFAPGNVRLRFATVTGGKEREYWPTEKGGKEVIERTRQYTRAYYGSDVRQNWDDFTKNESADREKRYFVTGNILKAYNLKTIGKLVSYTMADGSVRKGMLMGKEFRPDMSISVPIKYIGKLLANMGSGTTISTDSSQNSRDGITFIKSWSGDFAVIVPGNASTGAVYYKNEALIKQLKDPYTGFVKEKDYMKASVSANNMQNFLNVLHDMQISIKLTAAQYEVIKNDLPERKEQEERKESSIPRIIRLEAKYINEINMKQVAGISGITGNKALDKIDLSKFSPSERKAIEKLKKYVSKKNGLSGMKTMSASEMKNNAHKLGIDLDNLNI